MQNIDKNEARKVISSIWGMYDKDHSDYLEVDEMKILLDNIANISGD